MDFATIQGYVNGYLLDEVASTTALVPEFINKAMRDAANRAHNFKHMNANLSVTATYNTQLLAARPSLWKAPRGAPWLERYDGTQKELDWGEDNEVHRWYPLEAAAADISTGEPEKVLIDETSLYVYPKPDAESDYGDGAYRLRVPYYARLADLAEGTDENWWTTNAPWYLIFQAVGEGLGRNREDGRDTTYFAKAEREYQLARKIDIQSTMRETTTLIPRRGSFGRIRPPRRL